MKIFKIDLSILLPLFVCLVLTPIDLGAVSRSKAIAIQHSFKTEAVLAESLNNQFGYLSVSEVSEGSSLKRKRGRFRQAIADFGSGLKQLIKSVGIKPGRGNGHALAVAGLILGIIGLPLFFYLVPSLLALIFGQVSLKKYKLGYHDSKGLAVAALVLGIVGVVAALAFYAIIINGVVAFLLFLI